MKITNFGHSCFLVEVNKKKILFDPFITPNELASHIKVDKIKCDYILVSHGHEDHVADAIDIANRNDAIIVSNFEITNWFASKGVEQVHPMNIGGKWNFDFGTVYYVNALHSSSLPDGTYGGNPGGFIIKSGDICFYYAGDTGLSPDMKVIPDQFMLNFAFLPIGDNFTMGVDDAILASDYIACSRIVGMHYDTFGYIKIDSEEAVERFSNTGKELILPKIGETINIEL